MKLTTCCVLLLISICSAYNSRILDYALQLFEYSARDRVGTVECVFFDISSQDTSENIATDLLKSPRLQYVVKYVIQAPYRPEILPKKPLMLVVNLDPSVQLNTEEIQIDFYNFLTLFNPATPVLVIADFSNIGQLVLMRSLLYQAKCYKVLLLDPNRYALFVVSLEKIYRAGSPNFPHPRHIFEWFRNALQGNNITYVSSRERSFPPFQWLKVTAAYLKCNIQRFPKQENDADGWDISLRKTITKTMNDDFRRVFLNEPQAGSVLVPRGRLLNTLEIMQLPFEWPVWTMLAVMLTAAEVVKRMVPDLLRNDPVLLVVFGFERSNLHQAGRWEKIIMLSLIIVVFFVTNAFETKIISFLIDAPSKPSAKTLDDFNKFGLSFRYDLDLEPFAVNHPVIGKYVVHDTFYYEVEHTEPGVALYVSQSVVKLLPALSYDFERGKTWFVELEQKFLVYPVQIYYTGVRSRYLETFRFTHVVLREAGIMDWWEWQFAQRVVKYKWGSRPRGAEDGKKYLFFDDMWMAWIVLSFGCVASMVGFVVELFKKWWDKWL